MRSTNSVVRSLVEMFTPMFCAVDLETCNGLMRVVGELKMLSRRIIVPRVEHAMQIIGVDLCLLVLRPKGSIVLQGSHIMNTVGVL